MYLKSLVLKGFKSFADRSVFSLEPGITAIVGPNGSGKSNVLDSVLWVLGERNAKNLRGQAMEDVIFAGSSARKPVGVAEVDLVLDNTDGTLPIEYSEVALTRRMYRNGESEYLINGTPARRMDVLDILHDSGLGTGTHSIISQGHLSSILQSKPEDRRTLIEEAAGVLKHKQRKEKSERKLAQMDTHLARVQDITAEVERQVKPLERKAKRALAYRDIEAELGELNLQLAIDDLRTLQRGWDEVGAREKTLTEQLAQMRDQIAQSEAAAEQLQEKLQTETADAGAVAQRYRRMQTALDRIDSNILLLHEKKRSAQNYVGELRLSLESDARAAADLEAQTQVAATAFDEARTARAAADKARDEAQTHATNLQMQTRALQSEIDQATHRRRDALQDLEGVRAAQARTQEVLASNRANEKLIGSHAEELAVRLADAGKTREEAVAQDEQVAAQLESIRAGEEEARAAVGTALTARDEARTKLDEARDTRSNLAAEVRGLEEMERARQAANPLLAWVLDNIEAVGTRIQPLVDQISAPNDLEFIVDALLGDDVAALSVDDVHAAEAVARRLAEIDQDGAVTLLPRASMHARTASAAPSGTQRLTDALTCSDEARTTVEALLGDVLVCADPQAAHRAATSAPGACCVTRDGYIVWPNGKVSCIHKREGEAGALSNHRSLEEARAHLKHAQDAEAAAGAAVETCEEALRRAQTESLNLSQNMAQLRGSAQAAHAEAQRAQQAFDALQAEAQSLEDARARAREALAKAEPDAAQLDVRLQQLTAEIDEIKEDLDRKRAQLAPIRAASDEATTALADAKVAAATCAERCEYADRVLQARKRDIENAREARERAERNIRRKSAALTRIDPLLEVGNALMEAAKVRTRQLERLTNESQDFSSGLHQQINEARAKARAAHDAYDAANERIADVRVEKGRLEMQVEAAINTIVQDCKTPIEQALAMPALEERAPIEERAFKLRRRIANMGTINPDAAAEYEQLKARFDYLTTQLNDMLAARRALAKIVRVIDARMKDDFVNTFEEVNANFQQIFGVLFPGGSGSLALVDPDDPENTGVEVNAQPNGKRILKMSLMSGGEQSLTAMALLFAVYKTRSTPFYILDEVEAALDDTNLRRLCAYLNSMRDDTQFIMITHQRRTMEMADVLYGISMQLDGVTKVMSQRLEKALRNAEG